MDYRNLARWRAVIVVLACVSATGCGGADGEPTVDAGALPSMDGGLIAPVDASDTGLDRDGGPDASAPRAATLALGLSHTCARRTDGSAVCAGANSNGQLGDGTTTSVTVPVPVRLSNIVELAVGMQHTCARLNDETVSCWGSNLLGQLGDPFTTSGRSTPGSVYALSGVAQIVAGGGHTCARLNDGTVRCWGTNLYGVLGDGSGVAKSLVPVTVWDLTDVVELATFGDSDARWVQPTPGSDGHFVYEITGQTCARLRDGTVRCWGDNRSGQLGDGTTTNRSTPQFAVLGVTGALDIAVGDDHACALLEDTTVRCWGAGVGPEPRAVLGLTAAAELATGSGFSCARMIDGSVRCWGINSSGELGDGTTINSRPEPVVVRGVTRASEIVAGVNHSCERESDGTVRCWGSNASGQFGVHTLETCVLPRMGDDYVFECARSAVVTQF